MARNGKFVDYYEILQVNPRAESETISRLFRHLAKRYHPDNTATGDRDRFDELTEAHETLGDPEKRAAYDLVYEDALSIRLSLLDEAIGQAGQDDDRIVRERLLSVLYVQRRRDVQEPSVGEIHLERLLDCPREHLAFHLWYLKEKGWVQRTDRGFAITAPGIDEVEASRLRLRNDRLLTERSESRDAGSHLEARAGDPPRQG